MPHTISYKLQFSAFREHFLKGIKTSEFFDNLTAIQKNKNKKF